MEINQLEQLNTDNIFKAATESDIVDIDDLNMVYTPDFHLNLIQKVQALGSLMLSDEFEDRKVLQNIFWDYMKYVRFKMELYKSVELKRTSPT